MRFVSRERYRRNWEDGRTDIGGSATTGAKSSRLACFGVVIVCIVRSAVAYARGSSCRSGGRSCSVIRLVYSERRRVSGVLGVLSEFEGRTRARIGGRAVVVVSLSVLARVNSRRLVRLASVITVVTVVYRCVGGNFYDGLRRTTSACRGDGESACAAAIVGRPHHYRLVGVSRGQGSRYH